MLFCSGVPAANSIDLTNIQDYIEGFHEHIAQQALQPHANLKIVDSVQQKDIDSSTSSSDNKMAQYMHRGAAVQGKKDTPSLCLVAILRGSFQNFLRRQPRAEKTGHTEKGKSTVKQARCEWCQPVMSKRFLKEN